MTLDAKHRVTVPARHRQTLEALSGSQVTLARHLTAPCLVVFPRPAWVSYSDYLAQQPLEVEDWVRLILSSALDLEIDAASRLLLPAEMREMAGIQRDVMLLGMGSRLEIWDAATLQEREAKLKASMEMPAALKAMVMPR